jgi:hypothetical protein
MKKKIEDKSKGVQNKPKISIDKVKADKELRDSLLFSPEQLIEHTYSDLELDEYNLRQRLLSDKETNPKEAYILSERKTYRERFPLEFYRLIYILNSWSTTGRKLYNRPHIVAKWTVEIIYQRFPKGILEGLRDKNPSVKGARLHKHFQWLSLIGDDDLLQYIKEAMAVMRKCTYWYEFRRAYAKEYGLIYQGDLFLD